MSKKSESQEQSPQSPAIDRAAEERKRCVALCEQLACRDLSDEPIEIARGMRYAARLLARQILDEGAQP